MDLYDIVVIIACIIGVLLCIVLFDLYDWDIEAVFFEEDESEEV